jgi:hypothetical protein
MPELMFVFGSQKCQTFCEGRSSLRESFGIKAAGDSSEFLVHIIWQGGGTVAEDKATKLH